MTFSYRSPFWEEFKNSVFTGARSKISSRLVCEPMTSGVHKWSIQITRACNHDEICFVKGDTIQKTSGWITSEVKYFCIMSPTGEIFTSFMRHGKKNPTFGTGTHGTGDILTFTLDLSGNGCLVMEKDVSTGTHDVLARDFLKNFKNGKNVSFFPAVALGPDSEVNFLYLEQKQRCSRINKNRGGSSGEESE